MDAEKGKSFVAFCPRCHQESLTVTPTDGGKGYNAGVGLTEYWVRGDGVCSECGWKGEYSDSSL